ncbi:hypothetical protein LVD15_15085 [Fulvivirga maritima]|uniref:ParB N-terminal domain-containing protein n=1 Tax=Fulvivirga maritima TaxID=2904247 RepID=UPI001F43D021|nr:ParB N-terminal domain-containing protein [Fulvivirga maritima]UII24644.1 hypothetical protein LVD15_15085 [Fulvivirga maritima]
MKVLNVEDIIIKKEFKNFIIPLNSDEYSQLEFNILEEGCRDPLICWQTSEGAVLIDGHNRFRICKDHNLEFKTKILSFKDEEEVKLWMLNNQLGRRNLTSDQLSYYRGLKYNSLKRHRGGYENVQSKGQKELSTSVRLADDFKVSESTIKRDAKFTSGLDIIGKSNPKLKLKILKGEVKVSKADIRLLADGDEELLLEIKNEADLFNKAKIIKDDLLNEVESTLSEINEKQVGKAREYFSSKEPIFQDKDDQINRIKGRVISAINKAINKRDVEAIDELRKLIEKLENLLFT